MTDTPPRATAPRRWTTLTLAGTAAGFAATALPLQAAAPVLNPAPAAQVWLAQATSTEGGEGGEAGAPVDAAAEVHLLVLMANVGAHLRAAAGLYAAGNTAEAAGLAGHPEAEVMDELRPLLAAAGIPDFSDALDNVVAVMASGATLDEAQAAVDAVLSALNAGAATIDTHDRVDAMVYAMRDAGHEYEDSVADGAVVDLTAHFEAQGFVAEARLMALALAADGDAKLAALGQQALDIIDSTSAAFGDLSGGDFEADPSIIYAAASQIEFAALATK